MKIIAGLGNPGPKYETTRHNLGFLAVDRLVELWKAEGPAREFDGEIYRTERAGEKIYLVKPQTFMNNSGRCIAPLYRFYKCKPEDLIVIHDELDLNPLVLRIKTGGGSAGHNGLRSIDASLGMAENGYHRIRIGIGKPAPGRDVLDQLSDEELAEIDPLLDDVAKATEMLIAGEGKRAMNEFNGRDKLSGK